LSTEKADAPRRSANSNRRTPVTTFLAAAHNDHPEPDQHAPAAVRTAPTETMGMSPKEA
jgi:hypothetical protein